MAARRKLQVQNADSERVNLLKKAISIGIYATVAIITIPSIAGWIFVLLI